MSTRGNTVLDAAAIEEAVYPFLGPQKTLDDIEGARDALQKIYQARGYQSVFVELPEQKVDDGIVYLQVSETKVGRVRGGCQALLAGKFAMKYRGQGGAVPDFTTVQTQLAGLNRGVPVARSRRWCVKASAPAPWTWTCRWKTRTPGTPASV